MKNNNRRSNKKYRVKSKFRFITFIVIVMCICVAVFGALTGISTTTALTKSNDTVVEICAGDTLWDIANTYKDDNSDTRKAVFEICKANDINASDITPGMEIVIPENL